MNLSSHKTIARIRRTGCAALLLCAAGAAKADQAGDFYFTSTGASVIITNYAGPGGLVTIPPALNNLPVIAIEGAFFACNTITGVTIPPSVSSLGDYSFYGCSGLNRISIPDTVTNLGDWVFAYCSSLSSAAIGNGVTNVGKYDFESCTELTNISLGSGIRGIGVNAFDSCTSLPAVLIPDTITSVGGSAFADCLALTFLVIPDSVTNIQDYAFDNCGSLTSVTVGRNVSAIGDYAFSNCTNLAFAFFAGNAPTNVGLNVFPESNPAVFYLPGTSNWLGTIGGHPVSLWNPRLQTTGTNFGVRGAGFRLGITGTTNIPIVLEACTNLGQAVWASLLCCTLTNGVIYFDDVDWTNNARRYYRIRSP